jgi:outer membrane protein assembly factor BamD (BamD/ComL family)
MMMALATLLTGSLSGCFWRKEDEAKSGVEKLYEQAQKSMNSGQLQERHPVTVGDREEQRPWYSW